MDSASFPTEELVRRMATDDRQAFAQFFSHYHARLLKFAMLYVRSRELAEEAVSDVFLKLWQKRVALVAVQNINSYLYIAVKNQALNYLQKAGNQPGMSLDEVPVALTVELMTPERELLTAELQAEIQRAVEKLPPQCKIIFKLIREDGLKYKEVAEIMGISVKTIEVQMGIAIKKISAELQQHLQMRSSASASAANRVLRVALAAFPLLLGVGTSGV
ncbi:RNA polymerase sigma-70 factor (ECF subfamily) [Hymenobacter luteus]|uniref:RNA polymerase sigma-70 factor (ECF subfamily) n=2 Tax=Hymenobacter TaxID=89966 RepID=A0A7W9T3Q5_9BACT|nr:MULTISPECIES: RNA polymerase sigma-70 factor [Hymenobacter]MBB4603395.1 RNA polymerase sigma-70 factor (ECF subfamily) [Hymenobacter latericoloratus]MBB6061047.1 RNA polymerase sigma-70 factor (ECF subfamily) [Hymenobacter luteus]